MTCQLLLPAPSGTRLPKVSIHLPICNEPPQNVRETLDALAALDYDRFEVLVVDSNTTDPHLWEPVAEHCARLGPKFRFFTLGKYKGLKAGALNFALCETAPDADIIGVIDCDHIVAPDWLRAMVPAFADPKLGFAQSPRESRDADGDAFRRHMFGEHGATTLIRKQALNAVQGWAEWCVTEDVELALRLFRAGYAAVYAGRSFGKSVLPDDFAALRAQRARGAYGAMRVLRAHAGALLNPFSKALTPGPRWHFVAGWLPCMGDALGLAFLIMSLAWSIGLILDPAREVPAALVLLPFGLFLFKLAPLFAGRTGAALAGLALSHGIGKAVWRGLFTSQPPSSRMPKMTGAPALARGLAMAREEFWILLLIWSALLGVGISQDWATLEVRLWCAMLFIQSLPYLAAIGVSMFAAMPSHLPKRAPWPAAMSARDGYGRCR
ncbi:MAG TPA: glycosyltransferase [Acidocella sp.]|jgi:cellulose synthase/poly-beta-1,6-N-acetylglucosamine synthase-like glycosyltransferase|uniref:glycosyltransferase n=1 Tax=Acidocella sp. TaxID=50710 RepID=UPI002BC3A4F5|nr:glycosyltransferase [Acidocella sp.]HVE23314.1 glycosyltransferase [Acidocella sp.]